MILVESDISGEWDSSTDWGALAERSVRAAVAASAWADLIHSAVGIEASVKFTEDEEVHGLNRTYRGKDKPTNVLSFPMLDPGLLDQIAESAAGEALLGDIVLARGVCVVEAAEKGISAPDHACHLIVHGALHLLGYDHEEPEDERVMFGEQRRLLEGLRASMGSA